MPPSTLSLVSEMLIGTDLPVVAGAPVERPRTVSVIGLPLCELPMMAQVSPEIAVHRPVPGDPVVYVRRSRWSLVMAISKRLWPFAPRQWTSSSPRLGGTMVPEAGYKTDGNAVG